MKMPDEKQMPNGKYFVQNERTFHHNVINNLRIMMYYVRNSNFNKFLVKNFSNKITY